LQEQVGHYGPMIIDPAGADPVGYDREHIIVLSDWSFLHPHQIFSRPKQEGGFFNRQKEILFGQRSEQISRADRETFARMRTDPTDISDVTEATYTLLINGHSPREDAATSNRRSNQPTLIEFMLDDVGGAVTKREQNDTIREIEETQEQLKASIDESRRLAEKAQLLLDRHRKEGEGQD
jgi:hypothetical protein